MGVMETDTVKDTEKMGCMRGNGRTQRYLYVEYNCQYVGKTGITNADIMKIMS
jgi:hypothetical protein